MNWRTAFSGRTLQRQDIKRACQPGGRRADGRRSARLGWWKNRRRSSSRREAWSSWTKAFSIPRQEGGVTSSGTIIDEGKKVRDTLTPFSRRRSCEGTEAFSDRRFGLNRRRLALCISLESGNAMLPFRRLIASHAYSASLGDSVMQQSNSAVKEHREAKPDGFAYCSILGLGLV